jgi:SAM-dependent methyltransferase
MYSVWKHSVLAMRMFPIFLSASSWGALLVPVIWPIFVTSFVTTRRQLSTHQPTIKVTKIKPPIGRQQHLFLSSNLEEPDEDESNYGRMAYWDESYTEEGDGDDDEETNVFSWYCGWNEEMGPFFEELVPDKKSMILVPGIGNDVAIRDMFDFGGYHNIMAFDYAPQGVECAKVVFGEERLQTITNTVAAATSATSDSGDDETTKNDVFRVCDARDLSGEYGDNIFDAVLDKGTFDSVYLSGGKDKNKARVNLDMAVSEMKRVLKEDGTVFSVTAACVDAVREAFGRDDDWEQIRDGGLHITEDGYASNNVDATMLAWKLTTPTTTTTKG